MSIEATLDLRANSSPRSLCVFPASETSKPRGSSGTNPFDIAPKASPDAGQTMAVVYGTERGSMHYRTYASPNRFSRAAGGLAASIGSTVSSPAAASGQHTSRVQIPLGLATSGQRPSNLPRSYYPVDLSSLPGPVVSCVKLSSSKISSHFLLLVDDNRGTSAAQPGAYATVLVTFTAGSLHVVIPAGNLPRASCATYFPSTGLVYGAGRSISVLAPEVWEDEIKRGNRYNASRSKRLQFGQNILPAPGLRSGQDAIALTANGKVAIVVVGNAFYAVAGQEVDERQQGSSQPPECVKILSFAQSSQVHPVLVLDLHDKSMDPDWSSLFLASGRECAVVDLFYGPPAAPRISFTKPRHGSVTLASPLLAAAASWPWVAILTSDGLVSIRSPSCLAIALRTVEVGQRPNDFFVLRSLRDPTQPVPWIVALAYSGESKVLRCQPDTAQDLADRLMRHAIDAFGANGFPRSELAEAVNASFTAASYVGPEATAHARILLKQYLEAVLGMADFEGGASSGWPTELSVGTPHKGTLGGDSGKRDSFSGRGIPPPMLSPSTPGPLLSGSALLCLVCSQLSPPNSSLANRVAKACSDEMGVVFDARGDVPHAAAQVCDLVAEKLLREVASNFSLLSTSSSSPISHIHRGSYATLHAEFIEASMWLLRTAGKHEKAIKVAQDRLQQQGQQESGSSTNAGRGTWSQIKYESYTATHLSEIWRSGRDEGFSLVLKSPATYRLLENNPSLGLSVFTASHPQNENQWRSLLARDDPLAKPQYAYEVLKLLKSVNPAVPYDRERGTAQDDHILPLESARALSVAFLESAIGISSGRPTERDEFDSLPSDEKFDDHMSNFHDELSFLLLEGIIAERRDDNTQENDTFLGKIYRAKLRKLLKWPLARIRPERFMETLPASFLQEKALMLGRIGLHEDALRILYRDLNSLELALEYCDDRYENQKVQEEQRRLQQQRTMGMEHPSENEPSQEDNAYLPLVRVALDSEDKDRGIATAIQVLALRRGAIDRAAALRLLPSGVPVSAVARPFLIPALVDSESQVRRLTVVSALLRARYLRLKEELTVAQLKAQANLHVVPQLRSLNLGDPLHSSKAFRARTSATASSTMPDLMIVKHFFPNHLVIQAKVTNGTGSTSIGSTDYSLGTGKVARVLSDIAFVVAESSEEAIQPLLQVPIRLLPVRMTGSAWCVLEAMPSRMDGATAQLTCELRYTVQSVDGTHNPGFVGSPGAVMGRTYVEELQDLEIHAAHFI